MSLVLAEAWSVRSLKRKLQMDVSCHGAWGQSLTGPLKSTQCSPSWSHSSLQHPHVFLDVRVAGCNTPHTIASKGRSVRSLQQPGLPLLPHCFVLKRTIFPG